jgi:phospholipid N-methyltransferase
MMSSTGRREWWQFVRGFLRAPRTVGSIAPSSRHLVAAMLDAAQVERRKVMAEFGPGTGVFTTEIVRRMRPDARLLVFEIEPGFAARLQQRIRDPRVTVIQGSAADLKQHLLALGAEQVDCVVSGLPFASLPREVTHAILQTTRESLAPGGLFVTYQYTPMLLRLLRTYFPAMRIANIVLRNLPPALVLVCAAP